MAVRSYRDLLVWQRAMDFVECVYRIANRLPASELHALSSQLRRAAVSVASNIAEGQGRGARADFVRFLRQAQASLQETETQLLLCARLGFCEERDIADAMDMSQEIGRLNRGLMRSISVQRRAARSLNSTTS
jgi:four helix bundle protein